MSEKGTSQMTDNVETRPLVEMIGDKKCFNIELVPGVWERVDDVGSIDEDSWNQIVALGLKTSLMSKGMSRIKPGITKLEGKDLDDRKAAMLEQSGKNKEAIFNGTFFKKKAKEKKGALQTEALRLAKAIAMDILRANGIAPSKLKASDQTAAAKRVLENRPELFETARANLAKREEATKGASLDLAMLGITVTEANRAKPRKAKAKPKAEGQISAAQASRVAPRQRPGAVH